MSAVTSWIGVERDPEFCARLRISSIVSYLNPKASRPAADPLAP